MSEGEGSDGERGEGETRAPREWDADVELSTEDAAGMIFEEFPDLAGVRVEPFGEGFDNRAFRAGEWIFRFPRREFGGAAMEIEIEWLPRIAPELPLPIPLPERVGRATERFPWCWAGYRRIEGVTADRARLEEADRARWAEPLGRFLRRLHSLEVPAEAPGDDLGRADHRRRSPKVIERLSWIEDVSLRGRAVAAVEECARAEPWDGRGVWVHGDLYGRHLIARAVDARGTPECMGVIDWGDLHVGDRAVDLSIAWSFLPAGARGEFRQAYGEISEAEWRRARFRALHYASFLPWYGRDVGDPAIEALGRTSLHHALQPEPITR